MTLCANGKTILITGGNSGIGFAAAETLAAAGANVIITSRDGPRVERAVEDIAGRTGRRLTGMVLDQSSFAGINAFADAFLARFDRLDVLVNNAGAMFMRSRQSADGYEMTWAVNHLGPFLLTSRLLPLLQRTGDARIVTTASNAHLGATIDFDRLGLPESYSRTGAYGRSKLGNVLFTFALARRLEGTGVTANCLHPGVVATGFFRFIPVFGPFARALASPFLRTPAKGAETLVWLAGDDGMAGKSGGYYFDRQLGRLNPVAGDVAVQERIWDISLEQTGPAAWPFA